MMHRVQQLVSVDADSYRRLLSPSGAPLCELSRPSAAVESQADVDVGVDVGGRAHVPLYLISEATFVCLLLAVRNRTISESKQITIGL